MGKKLELPKELAEFLRRNRCIRKFERNAGSFKGIPIENLVALTIKNAFVWSMSPEGQSYWQQLHEKFENEGNRNRDEEI